VEKNGSGEMDKVGSKVGKASKPDWLEEAARLRSTALAMAAFISSPLSSFMDLSFIVFLPSDTFDRTEIWVGSFVLPMFVGHGCNYLQWKIWATKDMSLSFTE
jgi:hypothetical protein